MAIKVSLQSCTIKDVEGGTPEEVKRPHPTWVGNINMEHTGFVFLPELGSMCVLFVLTMEELLTALTSGYFWVM